MFIALRYVADGVVATELDDEAKRPRMSVVRPDDLASWVAEREAATPRWVWDDTAHWYPPLLAEGARIERALDLRLCRRILRHATATARTALATAPADEWDAPAPVRGASDALFELEPVTAAPDPVAELRNQRTAIETAESPGRLNLLLAAESVGALAAAEMRHAGLPWDADRHAAILTELLGPRPLPGARPAHMEAVLAQIRALLDDPELNPDSPAELLRGLQRAGLPLTSTRSWELKEIEHPAIAPLLEYKRLARLLTANGWNWLDQWVSEGRFRPSYVPGGVVTGRWATDGGGALQLPKQVRGAVIADPGWTFVVADAAQLEPRVLAAMSGDAAMARAGRATDLYQGMVDAGAVETRTQAKYGMLGAIYGGTTGESGRMRPRIERAFPVAMRFVEDAARAGEAGRVVSTWLGRSSPHRTAGTYDEGTSEADARRSRTEAAAWGRFTRNFVVQGTAAEWALCWIGALRRRLWELGPEGAGAAERPHLVFFLHDELIVHTPVEFAPLAAEAMRAAAADAGRLLFGGAPVEFALSVSIVENYADAR
ncbi:MAG: bifunctional 3'-5' exonuclease/DNA polymerase [Microbacteriaceae bacterium]|nr:bifunctional 3'-5' exonuclease/DNA polymerase [Microbacteriaceae bacterium]